MTTQRLPERALLYWRIRLLIGCLVPALLGGFILYGGKAFYHPDPDLDGSVCVAVLCVLSDVSSLL